MKPLARWTMGKVHERGWETLSESIRHFSKVYPEFDRVICCNNFSLDEIHRLSKFGVKLFLQSTDLAEFPFKNDNNKKATNFAWKLVPSRLNPSGHELWIDNDIIIRKRIAEIDEWMQSDCSIISMGSNQDYGRFTNMVNGYFCAGLFGLPPNFNFLAEILRYCDNKPLYGFDEQGLVSLIVSSMKYLVIPTKNLDMVGFWATPTRIRQMVPNIHFTRVNQLDKPKHLSWQFYKLTTTP